MNKKYEEGTLMVILNPLLVAKNRTFDGNIVVGTYVVKLAHKHMILLGDGYVAVCEDHEIAPLSEQTLTS
jgi:hypothetical protein